MTVSPVSYIVGSGRSGTTLLRVMLAGHRQLFSPPEMILAIFETMREQEAHFAERYWEKGGLRRALMDLRGIGVEEARAEVDALLDKTIVEVYAHLHELAGGRMIIDKCPHLAYHPQRLPLALRRFPNARFIAIVRHPGSTIRSAENMPMAEVMTKNMGVTSAEEAWLVANRNIRDFFATLPEEQKLTVRYEDLVSEPRATMEKVCAVLGVPFEEAVLDPYAGDRMREGPKGARAIGDPNLSSRSRIEPELATKWLAGFDPRSISQETKELAKSFGYDVDALALPPMAQLSAALGELLESAKRIEQGIKLPMDLDATEGRRFLMRMLAASVDTFVEHADVDRPRFHHAESPHRKMFADCPDTDYLRAPVRLDDGRTYRVWGRIPKETTYAGILLYGRGGRVGANLRAEDLKLDAEGRFELRVGKEPSGEGTWLTAQGDENAVMVRQYFTDRRSQRPLEVHVECEARVPPSAPLDALWLAGQIGRSRRMLEVVVERTMQAYGMISKTALNTFLTVPGEQLFPTPDNVYQVCWYRFGGDQLLLLRGRRPSARYFSISLCNAWLETFDYERHPNVHKNHSQLVFAPDGSFEVCLAHRDVGHPNWIDTAGHHAGYVIVRNLLLEGAPSPLTTQVMFEKELAARDAATAAG